MCLCRAHEGYKNFKVYAEDKAPPSCSAIDLKKNGTYVVYAELYPIKKLKNVGSFNYWQRGAIGGYARFRVSNGVVTDITPE